MWRIKFSKQGFTLVELLVIASILAMIAVAVFSTFASGLNVYTRIKTYKRAKIDVLLSLEKIEKDLRNTFRFSGIDFSGEAKRVDFPGLIKDRDPKGNEVISLGRVSYYLNTETGSLTKEEQSYFFTIPENSEARDKVKPLAVAEDVNFSYYYFDATTQKYGWKNSWNKAEGVPTAVKIEINIRNGSETVQVSRSVFIPAAG